MTVRYPVATIQGHGLRNNDFHWADEGEPVHLASVCHEDPDSRCGCARAFVGTYSGRSTSTARLAELDISLDELITRMWKVQPHWTREDTAAVVDNLISAVGDWPVGCVIERRASRTLAERLNPQEAALWRIAGEAPALARNAEARQALAATHRGGK